MDFLYMLLDCSLVEYFGPTENKITFKCSWVKNLHVQKLHCLHNGHVPHAKQLISGECFPDT